MNDQPESKAGQVKPAPDADAAAKPSQTEGTVSPSDDSGAPKELSPEEQMAAFEDALKEADWGHQPC